MSHTLAYEKGKNEVPRRAYGHIETKGWQLAGNRPEPNLGSLGGRRHLYLDR